MPISRTQLKRPNPVPTTKAQPKKKAVEIKEDLGLSLSPPSISTGQSMKEVIIMSNPDKRKGYFNDGFKKGDVNKNTNENGELRKRTKTRSKQKNIRYIDIHTYIYIYISIYIYR
jgi:hypothetical protein